jgi:hypothetical protein
MTILDKRLVSLVGDDGMVLSVLQHAINDDCRCLVFQSNRLRSSMSLSSGIGKSSIAAAACKYMSDRDMFSDGGITFFNAKKGNDYRSFLTGLQVH